MDAIDEPIETTIELDVPDERDYEYEPLFGVTETEGYNAFYPKTVFNQGLKPETKMACSRYGAAHAINAQNRAVAEVDGMRWAEMNPEVMWGNYLNVMASAEKEGATLQSSLKQFKDLRLITGYAKVVSIEEMKDAIMNFRPILTGSQNGDWYFVKTDHKYRLRTDGRIVGHIFCIVGFDHSGWIAVNSYGISNGIFHIPYELTSSLYTRYSMHDSRDAEVFNNKK